jgi:outer membrane biosynthesis protein TonB
MLKLLSYAAVASLFAIVQIDAGFAQSAPAADKAAPAATETKADKPVTDKSSTDKPASEKPAADKPEAVRSPTKPVADKSDDDKPAPAKKKAKKMTRQQELDHSVDSGTVPARYRSSVPKEYHQYIPFAKQ